MKLRITVEGRVFDVDVDILDDDQAAAPGPAPAYQPPSPPPPPAAAAPPSPPPSAHPTAPAGDKTCVAPLAGTVTKVLVKPGDNVAVNDPVVVMEAMKMETSVAAAVGGKVKTVHVGAGQSVREGEALVELE